MSEIVPSSNDQRPQGRREYATVGVIVDKLLKGEQGT